MVQNRKKKFEGIYDTLLPKEGFFSFIRNTFLHSVALYLRYGEDTWVRPHQNTVGRFLAAFFGAYALIVSSILIWLFLEFPDLLSRIHAWTVVAPASNSPLAVIVLSFLFATAVPSALIGFIVSFSMPDGALGSHLFFRSMKVTINFFIRIAAVVFVLMAFRSLLGKINIPL